MLLPVELIDRILSFLRGNHLALRACSKSHPLLFRLAEPYFYADIVLTVTEDNFAVSSFHDNVSKNPHILAYLRTLEIRAHSHLMLPPPLTQDSKMLSVISTIPRMSNLTCLKLSDTPFGNSLYDGDDFISTFRNCLQYSSVENLYLDGFHNVPLSILDTAKNIKKLTLSYCTAGIVPILRSPYQLLETLVIRSHPDIALLAGMTPRVPNLKSLQLRGMLTIKYDWTGFPELLAACSSTLTELHIDVGDRQSTHTSDSTNAGPGHWIVDNLEFPFTLSRLKNLKRLSISVLVFSSEAPNERRTHCAIPAIMRLIKTSPPIRNILLRLHWMSPDVHFFGRLDWSPLVQLQSEFPGVCPRIHLHVSVNSRGPDVILGVLAGNEPLMSLVKRQAVVLKPLAEGPDFFLIHDPGSTFTP